MDDFPTPETIKAAVESISKDDIATLKAELLHQGISTACLIECKRLNSHITAIRAFLREHGWACKLIGDQRDGDFYRIIPAPNR